MHCYTAKEDKIPINLPVRFTGDPEDISVDSLLELPPEKTAFLIVDCVGVREDDPLRRVIDEKISPSVHAARDAGMRVVYIYSYPSGGSDGPYSVYQELHRTRRQESWKAHRWRRTIEPPWPASIEPHAEDAMIAKCAQNSFQNSMLDDYLRGWGVTTVLVTGFSFKSCVFYTMVGAFERNYRVVLLRDGTHPAGMNEFRDTLDDSLPEKGWVRLVLTRLIEDHLGYTSTCQQLIDACRM